MKRVRISVEWVLIVVMALLVALTALLVWTPLAHAQQFSSGLTLKSVLINTAASGDNTIVAAVAGQVINVYGFEIFCNAANNVTLKDSTPTTLLPVQNYAANGGVIRDLRGLPWYTTAAGQGFIVNLSAAQQCSGIVYYTQG